MCRSQLLALSLLCLLALTSVAGAQQPASGINAPYRDPALRVDEWVTRLESEGRDAFDFRREIVAAMQLRAGQKVADIGAGTGLFVPLLAAAVGAEGTVYAVDIVPRFVEHIEARARERGLSQVQALLGGDDTTRLPAGAVDVAFVCDAYHHFEDHAAMLASIHRALRPDGELFVVDFERVPGKSEAFVLEHVRAGKEQFAAEIEQAGFRLAEEIEIDGMEQSYMLRFVRR